MQGEWLALALVALAVVLGGWALVRRARRRAEAAEREAVRLQRERDVLTRRVGELGQQLAGFGSATHDALMVVDGRRRVVTMNDLAATTFGGSYGQTLIEIVRDADVNAAVAESLSDGRARDLGLAWNGRLFNVHIVPSNAGAAIAFQDATELSRLQRARRDFVANISHELRTPLTSIGLLCDALTATTNDPDVAPLVATISGEVGAMTRLVNDMLDLTQIEDGRLPLRLAACDASDLIDTAVARLRPQAEQKGIVFAMAVEPAVRVLADDDKIERVLTNLLDNAVKFSPTGGEIVIRCQPAGLPPPEEDDVLFSVTDEGPGIAASDLPRVFERFFKVDRARERSSRVGAGLGLAIARHLVEAHEGHIWATSHEGQGATFYFTLPAA